MHSTKEDGGHAIRGKRVWQIWWKTGASEDWIIDGVERLLYRAVKDGPVWIGPFMLVDDAEDSDDIGPFESLNAALIAIKLLDES